MRSREVSQGRRPAWIGLTVGAAVVLGTVLGVQDRASGQEQNPQRLFNQDGGFLQSVILADKTADFEMVMQKVKEALQKSENPTRQQQLRGWKVYRVAEPGPNGSVIYFMVIDPSARGADYNHFDDSGRRLSWRRGPTAVHDVQRCVRGRYLSDEPETR